MHVLYPEPIGPHAWPYPPRYSTEKSVLASLDQAFAKAQNRLGKRIGALYQRPDIDADQRAWLERTYDNVFWGLISFLAEDDPHDDGLARAAEQFALLAEAERRLAQPALRVVRAA